MSKLFGNQDVQETEDWEEPAAEKSVKKTKIDLTQDFDLELPDGTNLHVPLSEVLVMRSFEDPSSYSIDEVEKQADLHSYYRLAVHEAYVQQQQHRRNLEYDFRVWMANAEQTAETLIMDEKGPNSNLIVTEKGGQKSGQGFSLSAMANMLSGSKIESYIVRHETLGPKWREFRRDIDDRRNDEVRLSELYEIMKDRTIVLQGMLKRHHERHMVRLREE